MRIEDGYLLSAWQSDNSVPPKRIYPYLVKKKGATKKAFDVSLSGRSFPNSYQGIEAEDFISRLLTHDFPEPATVRMKSLDAKHSPGNGWLIRNLTLDTSICGGDATFHLVTASVDEINAELYALIQNSKHLSPAEFEQKSKSFPNKPQRILATSIAFRRNPYVVVGALRRAGGHCEHCGAAAPFIRTSDGTPYLEVHHKTPLAKGGDDTLENAVALCPNCHREKHFGQIV